jgi:hypothetical protein
MAFEKGQYVVLKNDHNNPYSKETLVNIYGIIPEKTIGLFDREDKFDLGSTASVFWRLPNGEIKYLDVAINDIKLTTPPYEKIIPPQPSSVWVGNDMTTRTDPPSKTEFTQSLHGGKKSAKSRKSRKVRKSRKSHKKYRKSRKARKSRRRARR